MIRRRPSLEPARRGPGPARPDGTGRCRLHPSRQAPCPRNPPGPGPRPRADGRPVASPAPGPARRRRRARGDGSQAWKRATRIEFDKDLPEEKQSTRTKQLAKQLAGRPESRLSLTTEQAHRLAGALLKPLGITAGRRAGDTAYLLYCGYGQLDAIVDLVAGQAEQLTDLDDEALQETANGLQVAEELKRAHPMGVALFGRTVADIPGLDAAAQVAHALSTHQVVQESDYYTAVDAANEQDETGAGMIGRIGFDSAPLYRYAVVGMHQLAENLGDGDQAGPGAMGEGGTGQRFVKRVHGIRERRSWFGHGSLGQQANDGGASRSRGWLRLWWCGRGGQAGLGAVRSCGRCGVGRPRDRRVSEGPGGRGLR
ncbi:type I-E CRISPR-associated protein Cas7/Cse4/CasC [Actinomadura keratinilytica]